VGCWLPFVDGVLCVALYTPLHGDSKFHAVILSSAGPNTLYYLLATHSVTPGAGPYRLLATPAFGKASAVLLPDLHRNAAAAAASSTNEVTLGLFRLQCVNLRKPQPQRFNSSHCLFELFLRLIVT
jgi:hypothetical protein